MGWIVWAVIALLVIIIIYWVIRGQNKLVKADEVCSNALSQIGVQQTSRWDALTALADLTKSYSDHEYNALKDIIAGRQNVGGQVASSVVDQQEDLLGQAFSRIMAVAEAYPDLKANTIYVNTMQNVKNYEENVRISRMTLNDSVTKLNRLVRSFPDSILASIFGFSQREYLQVSQEKTEMPSMVR